MDTHIKNSGFCKLLVIFIFLNTVSITSQEIIKPKIQPGNQTNIIQQPDEPIDPGDGGPSTLYYRDFDRDGYGDPAVTRYSSTGIPAGYVINNTDCDDRNAAVTYSQVRGYRDRDRDGYGDASDSALFCYELDVIGSPNYVLNSNDCNDNNSAINPATVWYLDADNDGFAVSTKTQCTSPGTGYSTTVKPLTDCNDSNASINPNTKWYLDADNDGYATTIKTQCSSPGAGYSTTVKPTGDCNDSNASINPNTKWYLDADNDGFASTIKTQCANPGAGYSMTVKPTGDCNDSNASINPNTIWYLDADNDGFAISTKTQCANPGTGYSTTVKPLTDCNDSNASLHPSTKWYLDADNDGFAISTKTQCTNPGTGYSTTVKPLTDCNDSNAAINPNTKWYADTDGDGFGDPNSSRTQCTQPSGYVNNNTDQCPTVNGPLSGCLHTPYQAGTFSNENYIYTRSYQAPMTSSSEIKFNKDVIESITYFDGLGRPKQSIGIKQSPNATDIVTHVAYDEFGRQKREYLPYQATGSPASYRTNAQAATNSYYVANYATELDALTPNPFSETDFEPSPLNRVQKQAAPGKDWKLGSGHEIEFDYKTNTAGEVRLFSVNLTTAYVPTLVSSGSSYYLAGELYKTITRDENHVGSSKNHTTEEFKDKEGRVVLKRTFADVDLNNDGDKTDANESQNAHDTHYVYDRFGNLTYVIPPKVNTADGVSATELNELCYQYRYDSQNRLVEKKIPGKGSSGDWEEIVYNKRGQPILTRDPKLKAEQKWLFTKYDAFGRVAYTGLIDNTHSRTSLQTAADDTSRYEQFVQKTSSSSTYGGTEIFYNNDAFPQVMAEIHTINYYDNYTFDLAGLTVPAGNIYNQAIATNVKGLPTGSKVRVLGTNHWITTLMVYDIKGRAIYVAGKNEYLGTTDIVETSYDFAGKVIESKTTHSKGSNTPIVTIDAFSYDHVGRLLTQTQTINGGTSELIAENNYDNLGQLKSKGVGNVATSTNRLQTVDYTYNIRGWLKQINNPTTLGTDLFAFKIGYNEGSTPLYNGNISLTQWKTKSINPNPPNNPVSTQYTYTYDALNRITSAFDNTVDNRYSLTAIDYDKNGNIKNLTRRGLSNPASNIFGNMDILTYGYDNGNIGNKLIKVEDSSGSTEGFKNGSNTPEEYSYDVNGNMKSDANKGITVITYNHLNLPVQVTFASGNIQYFYSADGTKLKKAVSTGKETLYAGNYIYEGTTGNAQLQFFNHPEGYVTPDGSGGYDYVYNYVDHLGNIRLSYTDANGDGSVGTSEIVKESNYYPFGMTHQGYNGNVSSLGNSVAKRYMFGGKEYQEEFDINWYDITARNYDPALGRWMNLDPLAEQMRRHSPYNYAFDNPVYFIDPDGMAPKDWYLNLDNGDYEWHDGSAEKTGYWNLGKSTDVAVGEGYSLQDNGVFTDNNTGKTYGKGDNLAVGSTGSSIESNGSFFEETQTFVNHNKTELLTLAGDLQTAGDGIAITGYGAAVVGAAVAGVGAAPGAVIAGIGNGVGLAGSLLELSVNLMTEDYGSAGENATFIVGGQVIDMTFDRILPGPTPNISDDAYHILKQNFTTVKPIIIENSYEQNNRNLND